MPHNPKREVTWEQVLTSGGYFQTRTVARPDYVAAELLPSAIISLSDCICDFVPDLWAIAWANMPAAERSAKASNHGISPSVLPEVITWTTDRINSAKFGWPCVFLSVLDAQAFARRFLGADATVRLLGIALHEAVTEAFLETEKPKDREGTPGVYMAVSNRVALHPGGRELGWEVLCYDHGAFHSWLCNGLEREVAQKFGIRPSPTGFIASPGDALDAAGYCGREEVGAEPGFWAPWLVVEYGLSAEVA